MLYVRVPVVLCRYSYMIDNVVLLITGTLHQRPMADLIPRCHPLGRFEQLEAIHIATNPAELFNAILIDTPLGTSLAPPRTHTLTQTIHTKSMPLILCSTLFFHCSTILHRLYL